METEKAPLPFYKKMPAEVGIWLARLVTGCVFLFSGFTKGVDPWGTVYKIDSYLGALRIDLWDNLTIAASFLLSGIEFLIGVMLLTGIMRRIASWGALLTMVFMSPLTLWIALMDPVSDCGCFGDALILSNWATFWKNVALLSLSVYLIRKNRDAAGLVTAPLQWIAVTLSCIFIFVVEVVGYDVQPMVDFRPYKIGTTLFAEDTAGNNATFEFVYSKNGEIKVFKDTDELPEEADGWEFVERRELNGGSDNQKEPSGISVWDLEGETEIDPADKYELTAHRQLAVFIPNVDEVSPATTWKLNALNDWAAEHKVSMYGILDGTKKGVDDWQDLSMASYPLYRADNSEIKEVVRGNPGVVYIENDTIRWKTSLFAIETEEFIKHDVKEAAENQLDGHRFLMNLILVYLLLMGALVFISKVPYRKFLKGYASVIKRDGKAHL